MVIWAISCQKGGVGKTTTAVTLAGLLAARGHCVLLADVDPQGSATAYFGFDPQRIEPSLYDIFLALRADAPCEQPSPVFAALRPTAVARLALLPASTALATLERRLGAASGMGRILMQALRPLGTRFQYVLLDCGPALGLLMVNALAACDHVVIPVQTDYLALTGLERMNHTLAMIGHSLGRELPSTIVPTFYDARTRASVHCLACLQREYPQQLWPGVIPVDSQFREAAKAGMPISHFAPRSRGLLAYAQLLDDLSRRTSPAPRLGREGVAA